MSINEIPVNQTDNRGSSGTSGLLLTKIGIIVLIVLLIMAAWAGQTIIVIILGLVLSAAGISKLWSRLSLKSVHCERHLTEQRVFPDESVELKLRVVNRKLLPLPWLQVNDEVPAGFSGETSLNPGTKSGFEMISKSTSILWYSAVSWKYNLLCKKRGYYQLGPLTVTAGDIFGFYPRTAVEPVTDYLVVYPRIYTLSQLAIPSLYPLGEAKSEKRIFEDPSRTIGIRGYSPGDSLRRIHWKASARRQELQVKVFEPSTTLRIGIFLAVDSFQKNGIWDVEELELGISVAASLASHLADKNSQIGIWTNSKLADSGQSAIVPLGGGVNQLVRILETLAKVVPAYDNSFDNFLQSERTHLPLGITLVLVLSQISDTLKGIIADLRQNGYKLLIFQVGEANNQWELPDIPCYSIRQPGDLAAIRSGENQ